MNHYLRVYRGDAEIVDAAVEFISEGLQRGDRVFALIKETRWADMFAKLEARGVEHGRAAERRQFVLIDATSLFHDLIVDDQFDRDEFERRVMPLLSPTARPQRVFGEVTTMMAAKNNLSAALALEATWGEISEQLQLYVLCGLNLDDFDGGSAHSAVGHLLELHDRADTRRPSDVPES